MSPSLPGLTQQSINSEKSRTTALEAILGDESLVARADDGLPGQARQWRWSA